MATAIWWARRDLRLNDNEALRSALAHGGCTHAVRVIPVFVLDTCKNLFTTPAASAKICIASVARLRR